MCRQSCAVLDPIKDAMTQIHEIHVLIQAEEDAIQAVKLPCTHNSMEADKVVIDSEMSTDLASINEIQNICEYELKVEVLTVADLAPPEYRSSDLTHGLFQNKDYTAVYVELDLGGRISQTSCTEALDSQNSMFYFGDRVLFLYTGEQEMKIRARDQCDSQAILRDPVIGKGSLELTRDLYDCYPRWIDVPIACGDANKGIVSLRYQLQLAPRTPSRSAQLFHHPETLKMTF